MTGPMMYQGLTPACWVAGRIVAGVVPSCDVIDPTCDVTLEGSSAGGSREGCRTILANREPRRPGRDSCVTVLTVAGGDIQIEALSVGVGG